MGDVPKVRRSFLNTYLDSPVLEGGALELHRLLSSPESENRPRHIENRRKQFLDLIPTDTELSVYTPRDLPEFLRLAPEGKNVVQWEQAHSIASSYYSAVQRRLGEILNSAIEPHTITPDQDALSYLKKAGFFKDYIDGLSRVRALGKRGVCMTENSGNSLLGDEYAVVWIFHDSRNGIIFPYEAILMIKDLLWSRANVIDTISALHNNDTDLKIAVVKAWAWCEACLHRYGNPGYEILKSIESLSKAYAMSSTDPILDDWRVYTSMISEVGSKEKKMFDTYPPDCASQASEFDKLMRSIKSVSIVVEVFGLQKTTGHPLVDPRVGGLSAAAEAGEKKTTTYTDAKRLRNNWRRMYVEGFVKRTGRWPPLIFTPEAKSTRLFQLYGMRERKLERNSYPLSDWDNVKFAQHSDFEYYENFLDLMDDKAISHYLDEFRATWRKSVKTRSHRRLLLEMLSRPHISIKDIVTVVEQGAVPEEWLIVSLYPKEREFKLAPRMFSMMVFEMRAFFACLESNLADKIYPYLPQQTMTLDRQEILTKFFEATRPSTREEILRLFLEIDLTRWNLRWRDLPIRMIGEDLNDIFGLDRSYTFVHEFFQRCLILVRVASYEPEGLDRNPPPQSDLLWYNHEGGFEGIAQKHWTIATYSMIDLGVEPFDLKYQLFGQGDNQILLCDIDASLAPDRKQHLVDLVQKIKDSIADSCSRVGQEAKPEECLESTNLVTYSKDFFLNGVLMQTSLKAFSRIFPRGMSEIPTISNNISAIGSGCLAASERVDSPFVGYYMMIFHLSRYLLELPTSTAVEATGLSKKMKELLSKKLISRILCTPSSLGGFSVPGPADFLWKGGSDTLTKDLSSAKLAPEFCRPYLSGVLRCLKNGTWTKKDHLFETILQDPLSLPISTSPLVESRLKVDNLNKIRSIAKNQEILDVLSSQLDDHEEDLLESLLAVEPFNPLILADILEHSAIGLKSSLSSMFTSTRTIQALPEGEEFDAGSVILNGGASQFSDVSLRLNQVKREEETEIECCYTEAEILRALWKNTKTNDGKTQGKAPVGLSNYSPIDWIAGVNSYRCNYKNGHIYATLSPSYDPTCQVQGTEPLYLGTPTMEKRSRHGYKIVVSSKAEKSVSRLFNIMTQPGVDESFQYLVSQTALARTGVDLRDLTTLVSKAIGGNISHRYSATQGMQTASVLGNCTITSHMTFHSDNAGILSASTDDYPVMFQEFYTAAIGLYMFLSHRGVRLPTLLEYHVPETLQPLPSEVIQAARPLSLHPPLYPNNRLLFVNDVQLMRQERPYEASFASKGSAEEAFVDYTAQVRAKASRALRKGSAGVVLADTGNSARINLNIDILEYRGLGMKAILNGISESVLDFLITALFTRNNLESHWVIPPLVDRLAQTFVTQIMRAIKHPIFQTDNLVQVLFRPSCMKYTERDTRQRLASYIQQTALSLLEGIGRKDNTSILLFEDDEESATVDTGLLILRKLMARSVVLMELSHRTAISLDRKVSLAQLRLGKTTEERITRLTEAALILREWSMKNRKPHFETGLNRFLSGDLLFLVPSTLQEVIRSSRSRAMTISTRIAVEVDKDAEGPLTLTRSSGSGVRFNIAHNNMIKKGQDLGYSTFMVRRAVLRKFKTVPETFGSFFPSRRALRANTLIILGSGNGGAALCGSMVGVSRLILHDLQDDVDPEYWLNDDHGIPILRYAPTECMIERSRAGYENARGDIRRSETWEDLRRLAPTDVALCVDIPIVDNDDLETLNANVSKTFGSIPVVTRWILPDDQVVGLSSEIGKRFSSPEYYVTYHSDGWCEVIVRGIANGHSDLKIKNIVPTSQRPLDIFRSYDTAISMKYGDLRLTDSEVGVLATRFDLALRREAHKQTHGFSFSQWTRVLQYMVLEEVASLDTDKGIERVASMHSGPHLAYVSYRGKVFNVTVDAGFRRFLLTEATSVIRGH